MAGNRDRDTVAGRELEGERQPEPDVDDLAGVEAFAPRAEGDPDNPFATAFAEGRRGGERGPSSGVLAPVGLVLAILVLLSGILSVALGLADEDDGDERGDDVATAASTTTSTVRTTTSSAPSTTSTTRVVGTSTTATTTGFAPGATPTTVRRPTVTTVRPSTTLPTATTLPENRALTASVEVTSLAGGGGDLVAGEPTEITITLRDPDAIPTGNCLAVVVEGGMDDVVLADNTCDTDCPSGSSASTPSGGTFENVFTFSFPEPGTFHVVVTGTSGRPGCGNRYAERVDEVRSAPITVAAAD